MKIKITVEKEHKAEEVIKRISLEEMKQWELLELNVNYREDKVEAIFEIGAG